MKNKPLKDWGQILGHFINWCVGCRTHTHLQNLEKSGSPSGSSSIQAWGFFNMYAQSKCIPCSSRSHPNKNLKIASHLVLEPWHSSTGLPLSPGVAWFDPTILSSKKRGQKSANPEKSLPPTKPSPKSKNYKVHLQFWTISGQFDFELIPFRKQF